MNVHLFWYDWRSGSNHSQLVVHLRWSAFRFWSFTACRCFSQTFWRLKVETVVASMSNCFFIFPLSTPFALFWCIDWEKIWLIVCWEFGWGNCWPCEQVWLCDPSKAVYITNSCLFVWLLLVKDRGLKKNFADLLPNSIGRLIQYLNFY